MILPIFTVIFSQPYSDNIDSETADETGMTWIIAIQQIGRRTTQWRH